MALTIAWQFRADQEVLEISVSSVRSDERVRSKDVFRCWVGLKKVEITTDGTGDPFCRPAVGQHKRGARACSIVPFAESLLLGDGRNLCLSLFNNFDGVTSVGKEICHFVDSALELVVIAADSSQPEKLGERDRPFTCRWMTGVKSEV